MEDKEPERYYDWMLWKMRQEDKKGKGVYAMSDTTKLRVLKEEIDYARRQLQPHDTGHIHTAINWMKQRVQELHKGTSKVNQEVYQMQQDWYDVELESFDYKYNEKELIAQFKAYIDSTYDQHYSQNKYQATEIAIEAGHGTGFCIGNILKYAQRYGRKGSPADARKDLVKIMHYALIQLYIHDQEN